MVTFSKVEYQIDFTTNVYILQIKKSMFKAGLVML